MSLLMFCYYLSYKIQPLVKLVDHLLTAGHHRTFDVIQGLSNVFGQLSARIGPDLWFIDPSS